VAPLKVLLLIGFDGKLANVNFMRSWDPMSEHEWPTRGRVSDKPSERESFPLNARDPRSLKIETGNSDLKWSRRPH
jgi:hypothetical protein